MFPPGWVILWQQTLTPFFSVLPFMLYLYSFPTLFCISFLTLFLYLVLGLPSDHLFMIFMFLCSQTNSVITHACHIPLYH